MMMPRGQWWERLGIKQHQLWDRPQSLLRSRTRPRTLKLLHRLHKVEHSFAITRWSENIFTCHHQPALTLITGLPSCTISTLTFCSHRFVSRSYAVSLDRALLPPDMRGHKNTDGTGEWEDSRSHPVSVIGVNENHSHSRYKSISSYLSFSPFSFTIGYRRVINFTLTE